MVDVSTNRPTRGVAACPFCGQPLLDNTAVRHLEHQVAAYETKLRQQAEDEAQSRADARVQAVEKAVKTDAAEQLKRAARESARAVAALNRQLQVAERTQAAKVKAAVQKRLAEAEREHDLLEQEFSKRERQLKLAAQESASAAAALNRQLKEAERSQTAKVQAAVQKQLAVAEKNERDRLEQHFAKREKQLESTVTKLQEHN